MKKSNLLIIFIIILSIVLLISACSKDSPNKGTPIEPAEPDIPKETIKDTSYNENKLNSLKVFLSSKKTFNLKT